MSSKRKKRAIKAKEEGRKSFLCMSELRKLIPESEGRQAYVRPVNGFVISVSSWLRLLSPERQNQLYTFNQ